jgi:uncharacterized protein YlaI
MNVKCLLCEKDLELDGHGLVNDGGFVYVEFHYGSKHDQCKGFGYNWNEDVVDCLLGSDEIEAYICDDCFDKKHHLMRGFKVEKKQIRTERKHGEKEEG